MKIPSRRQLLANQLNQKRKQREQLRSLWRVNGKLGDGDLFEMEFNVSSEDEAIDDFIDHLRNTVDTRHLSGELHIESVTNLGKSPETP